MKHAFRAKESFFLLQALASTDFMTSAELGTHAQHLCSAKCHRWRDCRGRVSTRTEWLASEHRVGLSAILLHMALSGSTLVTPTSLSFFTRAATAPMIDFLESIVSRSLSQSSLFASAKSGAVGCLERNCACDAFDPEAPPGDASSILCVHPLDCRRICDELTNCTAFEACAERNRRLPRLVSCSVAFVSFCGTIIPINLRDAHLVCVTRA